MKYSIISIDNKREQYKKAIRAFAGCEETKIASVDGKLCHERRGIKNDLAILGLELTSVWPLQLGEIGVWMSNYLHWQAVSAMDEPLIVFEDDAIIGADFGAHMRNIESQLPEDWDFVALWVPDNQRIDYRYNLRYNEHGYPEIFGLRPEGVFSYFDYYGSIDLAKVYQGYGMVAMMYSPQGGRKLVQLAKQHGLRTPVDCFIFEEAHKNTLNGYAPKPDRIFVDYDWPETTIHNTEKYE